MSLADSKRLICIPSSNHDMVRMRDTLDEEEMKLAFAFLLSMPGAPFIYYGDEIGMKYLHGLTSVEGGYGRTGSRSPMQWNATPNAGFSSAAPDQLYIPIDPDSNRPNVAQQQVDPDSLYLKIHLPTIRESNGYLLLPWNLLRHNCRSRYDEC